ALVPGSGQEGADHVGRVIGAAVDHGQVIGREASRAGQQDLLRDGDGRRGRRPHQLHQRAHGVVVA
ncbi:hypothetical protein, partial [Klebsiella pneumoniae]|uniref:hypothetical protein n=1 Tax=Klebsiella pneumoniae TaxID=573 RepID=UPI00273046A9